MVERAERRDERKVYLKEDEIGKKRLHWLSLLLDCSLLCCIGID